MAWLRIDDRVRTHPKIAKAGPAAAWLWFCGICYCREHLTDGTIPKAVVTSLAMNLPSPWRHAAKLVEVGLWEDAPAGYQVHDFLDWNPSRAEVTGNRKAEAERKRTERGHPHVSGRTSSGVHEMSSHERAGDAGSGSPSEALSGSLGSSESGNPEESARETIPAVHTRPIRPARAKPLMGSHMGCYYTPEACNRGICVPAWLGAEWLQQFADPEQGQREIVRAVREAIALLPDGPVGDEPKAFWRGVWKARHGSVVRTGSRTGDSVDAAREFMTDRIAELSAAEREH